jgi:hypothetical protein
VAGAFGALRLRLRRSLEGWDRNVIIVHAVNLEQRLRRRTTIILFRAMDPMRDWPRGIAERGSYNLLVF